MAVDLQFVHTKVDVEYLGPATSFKMSTGAVLKRGERQRFSRFNIQDAALASCVRIYKAGREVVVYDGAARLTAAITPIVPNNAALSADSKMLAHIAPKTETEVNAVKTVANGVAAIMAVTATKPAAPPPSPIVTETEAFAAAAVASGVNALADSAAAEDPDEPADNTPKAAEIPVEFLTANAKTCVGLVKAETNLDVLAEMDRVERARTDGPRKSVLDAIEAHIDHLAQ